MPVRPALLALFGLIAVPARAQVIEIADDGAAVTYARPAVFTADQLPALPARAARTRSTDPLAEAANARGIDPALLRALAWQESRGRVDAVSPKGALGPMQLMPATAAMLGVDPRDPAQNVAGGARYLRQQLDLFGSVPLALAAYNAGPGAVLRFGGVPPFVETRRYVADILARWRPGAASTATPAPRPRVTPLLIEVPTL